MFVAYGYTDLHLPYSHSLKEKRGLLHGVSSRIRKRFNVSVAEVDNHDLWQRARLGFSVVTHNMPELELIISSIRESLDCYSDQMIVIDFSWEIISL